jgi:hypothetical protein
MAACCWRQTVPAPFLPAGSHHSAVFSQIAFIYGSSQTGFLLLFQDSPLRLQAETEILGLQRFYQEASAPSDMASSSSLKCRRLNKNEGILHNKGAADFPENSKRPLASTWI